MVGVLLIPSIQQGDRDAGDPPCWAGAYSEHQYVCCHCGYPDCWQPPYFTSSRCCHHGARTIRPASVREGWPRQSVAAVQRNFTEADAIHQQATLCSPDGRAVAAQCAGRSAALSDDKCRRLLTYVSGLSLTCTDMLMQVPACAGGLLLAVFLVELHAPFLWSVPRKPHPGYDTCECTQILRRLQRGLLIVLERDSEEGRPGSDTWYKRQYGVVLERCAAIRDAEISALIPEAQDIWDLGGPHVRSRSGAASKPQEEGRPQTRGDGPSVGIVIALNWGKSAHFYGQTLEMWECYCRRHGDCRVILDTDELAQDAYPQLVGIDEATGQRFVRLGKEWNRWFALERHLGEFELSYTADPDQFPSRQCYGTSFTTALKAQGLTQFGEPYTCNDTGKKRSTCRGEGSANLPAPVSAGSNPAWSGPDVIMRDFPRFHSLNSAGVFFRNSRGVRLLFRLLFDKVHWYGLPNLDQSAFDHTLLEFVDLWNRARGGESTSMPRSVACLRYLLAIPSWRTATASQYAECWHSVIEATFGAFDEDAPGRRAQRGSSIQAPVHLADPRIADFNYVLGNRSWTDEPLVYHYAGKDKHHSNGEGGSLLDSAVRSLWGGGALPPRRRPGPWARPNRSWPAWGRRGPRCGAWHEAAAGAGACEPGTAVTDCRGPATAFC